MKDQAFINEVAIAMLLISSSILVTLAYYPGYALHAILLLVTGFTALYGFIQVITFPLILAYAILAVITVIAWHSILMYASALLVLVLSIYACLRASRDHLGLGPFLAAPITVISPIISLIVAIAAALFPFLSKIYLSRKHSMVYTAGLLAAAIAYAAGATLFYYFSLATASTVYSVFVSQGFKRCPFRVEVSSLLVSQGLMLVVSLLALLFELFGIRSFDVLSLLYAAGYYTFTASILAPTGATQHGKRTSNSSYT